MTGGLISGHKLIWSFRVIIMRIEQLKLIMKLQMSLYRKIKLPVNDIRLLSIISVYIMIAGNIGFDVVPIDLIVCGCIIHNLIMKTH